MKALTPSGVPALAVASGATSPNPGYNAIIWSTTSGSLLYWNGTSWGVVSTGGGGGGGSIIASGMALLNFGLLSAKNLYVTQAVTGVTGILAGSKVAVWVQPAVTAEHDVMDHVIDPPRVIASDIIAATGFTIHAFTTNNLPHYGNYNVAWQVT